MEGAKSAVGSITVWGGIVAALAGAAQLLGYTISADDQAALVNLIQSGVTAATAVAAIIGGLVSIWGRVRARREITGVTPQGAAINAAIQGRRTGLAVLALLYAGLALSACQGIGTPLPPPSQPQPVAVTAGNTACAVLRWGVPIAVSRLPTMGPQGQAIVADAQAVIAAGCAEADATWQQRAAAAAAALVKVLWGLITG